MHSLVLQGWEKPLITLVMLQMEMRSRAKPRRESIDRRRGKHEETRSVRGGGQLAYARKYIGTLYRKHLTPTRPPPLCLIASLNHQAITLLPFCRVRREDQCFQCVYIRTIPCALTMKRNAVDVFVFVALTVDEYLFS